MSVFLVLMCTGLVGLALMALPGMSRHGRSGAHGVRGGHPLAQGAHRGGMRGHAAAPAHAGHGAHAVGAGSWLAQLWPEPRMILSLLALFGAFGNLMQGLLRLSPGAAAAAALVAAALVEGLVVGPLWRFALRFQGLPSSSLAVLVLEEARAVTAFKNGKGIVEVVRDGRAVQLSARLAEGQLAIPVRVGDKLRVQDVDAEAERVTVSHF